MPLAGSRTSVSRVLSSQTLVMTLLAAAINSGCTTGSEREEGEARPTVTQSASQTSVSTERCAPHAGIRCTNNGEFGPWDRALLSADGRHLAVKFDGFCGDDPENPYRATVREEDRQVVIAVYGPRPFGGLCSGQRQLSVRLVHALGHRTVIDAFDGRSRGVSFGPSSH